MGWEGAFCKGVLRKCRVGMTCRHIEQRMELKIESSELKVNVEEKATQRGASAYTAWSVEKDGVQRRHFPYKEAGNHVKDFRSSSLCLSGEASAVLAALPSRLASPFVPFVLAFRPVCFAPASRLPSPSVPFAPALRSVCFAPAFRMLRCQRNIAPSPSAFPLSAYSSRSHRHGGLSSLRNRASAYTSCRANRGPASLLPLPR